VEMSSNSRVVIKIALNGRTEALDEAVHCAVIGDAVFVDNLVHSSRKWHIRIVVADKIRVLWHPMVSVHTEWRLFERINLKYCGVKMNDGDRTSMESNYIEK
jgi:hypothetical protein